MLIMNASLLMGMISNYTGENDRYTGVPTVDVLQRLAHSLVRIATQTKSVAVVSEVHVIVVAQYLTDSLL